VGGVPKVNPTGGVGPVLLVAAVVSPGEATAVKVMVAPFPAEALTLVPEGVLTEIFATKASLAPLSVVENAPGVVGKSVEKVCPTT